MTLAHRVFEKGEEGERESGSRISGCVCMPATWLRDVEGQRGKAASTRSLPPVKAGKKSIIGSHQPFQHQASDKGSSFPSLPLVASPPLSRSSFTHCSPLCMHRVGSDSRERDGCWTLPIAMTALLPLFLVILSPPSLVAAAAARPRPWNGRASPAPRRSSRCRSWRTSSRSRDSGFLIMVSSPHTQHPHREPRAGATATGQARRPVRPQKIPSLPTESSGDELRVGCFVLFWDEDDVTAEFFFLQRGFSPDGFVYKFGARRCLGGLSRCMSFLSCLRGCQVSTVLEWSFLDGLVELCDIYFIGFLIYKWNINGHLTLLLKVLTIKRKIFIIEGLFKNYLILHHSKFWYFFWVMGVENI